MNSNGVHRTSRKPQPIPGQDAPPHDTNGRYDAERRERRQMEDMLQEVADTLASDDAAKTKIAKLCLTMSAADDMGFIDMD